MKHMCWVPLMVEGIDVDVLCLNVMRSLSSDDMNSKGTGRQDSLALSSWDVTISSNLSGSSEVPVAPKVSDLYSRISFTFSFSICRTIEEEEDEGAAILNSFPRLSMLLYLTSQLVLTMSELYFYFWECNGTFCMAKIFYGVSLHSVYNYWILDLDFQ